MSDVTTFLFADLEGSTRLWEQDPQRMRPALARHDDLARAAVERNRGVVVKMTGDGVHAAFDDPRDALQAALDLQRELVAIEGEYGLALRARCALHAGVDERRANDYFGNAVNRAARLCGAAHGGQILVSRAVQLLVSGRMPESIGLREIGEVRLRDLATPEHVYQVLHPDLRSDFPPLREMASTPHNLPAQLTSFIGREVELREVAEQLSNSRLVTLHGAGGLGKTRLSIEVAGSMLDAFADGVWFVDLAPLRDPARVAQVVASTLGVKEEAGRGVIDALADNVRDRAMLIVLDNCEHVLQACAEVATRLLRAGSGLKMLATSREPLRSAGETIYPVPALSLPTDASIVDVETVAKYEAVRLFVARAKAVQPTFALTSQNVAAVTDICRRVDGIPLAIELAAACVRALSVQRIASRLNDRFALLRGGDRTALPRQQTLRALIDWSYDLLDERERAVFRRLAVFAGGFTLEAAEAVAAGDPVAIDAVIDVLGSLVEKSLVVLEPDDDRYRLLDSIREYAHQRLDERGEADKAHANHTAYYASFAESARPHLTGPDARDWLARIDQSLDDLLSAHRWGDRQPSMVSRALSIGSSLKHYWMNRGLLVLGYATISQTLQRPDALHRDEGRCRALFDAGQLALYMGRRSDAGAHLEESLAIARETGDRSRVAMALQPLAFLALEQSDSKRALRYLEESVEIAKEVGNRRELAAALNGMTQVCRVDGEYERAFALCHDVLAIARELGDSEMTAVVLLNRAMVAISRDSTRHAVDDVREVIDIASSVGSLPATQGALDVCAALAALRGDFAGSAKFFGATEALAERTGIRRDATDAAFLMPSIAKARLALGEHYAPAEREGRALQMDDALAFAREWLAVSR